ncbi:MAG: hypothetical protein QMD82_05525 [bacterium]|nr:hypothetical protein [bacterium]
MGGYGLSEEPFEAEIRVGQNSVVEFYVAAVDKVGNVRFSKVYAFRVD